MQRQNSSISLVAIVRAVKLSDPLFSYQAILSSSELAESTSISPSESTSIAKTSLVYPALVVIFLAVKLSDPLFSYQAILSSIVEADRTSISPSESRSIAKTE